MESSKCNSKLLLKLCLALFLSGLGCHKVTTLTPSGTAIVLDKTLIDLGSIGENESKAGQITVYNRASYPIKIQKVYATCGCTSASVTQSIIPQGTSVILNVELSAHSRRGKFSSKVSLDWTSIEKGKPANGTAEVIFEANAVYLVKAIPSSLEYEVVPFDSQPITRDFELIRGTQQVPFTFLTVNSSTNAVEVNVSQKNRDIWTVSATLFPEKTAAGPVAEILTVTFLDSTYKELARRKFHVRAEIKGLVTAKPKSVFFGVLTKGDSRQGSVTFEVPKGRAATIKNLRLAPNGDYLTFEIPTPALDENNTSVLNYRLNTLGKQGALSSRLYVEFADKELGTISVPFILYVK